MRRRFLTDNLIQIADAALADSYARAGQWMACKPGCHPCCIGVFPITSLDAARLREALATADPITAEYIRRRASETRARLSRDFPGDSRTGELFTEPHHEAAFDDFANDEPCPVLDSITGTCDLYAARPIPCRTFGPPMPNAEGGLAVCELCFVGAPETEVARCAVDAQFLDVETEAVATHEVLTGARGLTLIAFALSGE
ncbi:MAG: YkgJ family cysteine cluster protein [Acidobacteriota bacterium]|nr:YkgJ family cysteine cluster protein [Acidobacteriota bacterium]